MCFFVGCGSSPEIVIKKELIVPLNKYKSAYIDVRNDGYTTDGLTIIRLDIAKILRENGLEIKYKDGKSDLRIKCHYSHGLGMPRIIRHFSIKATYITRVNMILIDADSGTIIGEAEYVRPFTKTNKQACPEGFIKKMFEELIESRKQVVS
jgi:hypothetical protein